MELTTLKKKIKVLEHAFAASAGAYYSINLTKNLVPGAMYQVIDDKEYSINEEIGMPENAKFSDVVSYWGQKLSADQQQAYFSFFDIPRLINCYRQGNSHVFLQYWTKTALFEPMLAEQHIVMYTDEDNGDILAITYVLDLTEKYKEAQYTEKLRIAAEDAKKANIAKTDFLRRMSHDIRTPINGIRGIVSIANHYPNDAEKQKECRDKIMQASGFLLDLVNSVLDMNKLESGAVVLSHEPFDLRTVLSDTRNIIEMQGQEYAIQFFTQPTHIEHPYVLGSPLHLRQILQNIAGNAVKYNHAGGHINASCDEIESDGKRAVFLITCTDNGRGMSEDFLKRAFEPFAQECDNARTEFTGTGLGLAIAKQLIELMGGSIEIESTLGVGTKVSMTIPFDIDVDYKAHKAEDSGDQKIDLSGVRVLLVEDNDLNMEIAKFMLEKAGMVVTSAWNGQEALDKFLESNDNRYDVILMDVMMPIMDGLDATRAIRAAVHPDAKTIPIFAMTANAFPEDIAMSKAAGMNEHLTKPLQEGEVLRTIHRYVKKRVK